MRVTWAGVLLSDKANSTSPSREVAERAGMATDYLEYLEDTPTAEPSSSALMRIALALEMSVSDLLGGEQGRADGLG